MANNAKAYGELGKIIQRAGRIASADLIRKSAKTFGEESFKLARATASAGQNPMGRKWRPKSPRTRPKGRPLAGVEHTLRLVVHSKGFKVHSPGRPWLGFHQRGAKSRKAGMEGQHLFGRRKTGRWKLPKRSILPKKKLPPKWEQQIVDRLQADWYDRWR